MGKVFDRMGKEREMSIKHTPGPWQVEWAGGFASSVITAPQGSATALESLVALRQALPSPFRDFVEFERSRVWRRKDAIAVFDRALKAVQS